MPDVTVAHFFWTRLHYGTVCGLILSKLLSEFRFACVGDGGCECFSKQFVVSIRTVRSHQRPFGLGGGTKAPQVFVVSISFGSPAQKIGRCTPIDFREGFGRLLGLLLAKLGKLS